MKTLALIVFLIMYIFMIFLPKYRPLYAVGTAFLFILFGIMPIDRLHSTINWNVLMMIASTMLLVHYFIASKMPNLLADFLLKKSRSVMWVTIYMSLFAGIISAFIDNVATVLMVAPVGIAICKKLNINPVGMILSIAVSSNLQGAATLVGDTTSIMLGDYAGMSFIDFFWMLGKPGIFFAVELGALATIPVMMILFRKDNMPVTASNTTQVHDYLPTVMLVLMVAALIVASLIPNTPDTINGIICCALALVMMIVDLLRKRDAAGMKEALKNMDWETLLLLTGLFVVIGGITEVGLIDDISAWIVRFGGDNIFLLYTIIVWGSVLISAFVDNIPYVATMLPVLTAVTSSLGIRPYLLFFGLLSGATLGGNITPIGASANIAGVGLLKKEGYTVSFGEFMRIGLPYTMIAVLAGYLYLWLVWR